jgi:hypothetical protein
VLWSEELEPEAGVVRRVIRIDLQALRAGNYDLRLNIAHPNGNSAQSTTRFVLAR